MKRGKKKGAFSRTQAIQLLKAGVSREVLKRAAAAVRQNRLETKQFKAALRAANPSFQSRAAYMRGKSANKRGMAEGMAMFRRAGRGEKAGGNYGTKIRGRTR